MQFVITRSLWLKVLVMTVAMVSFVFLYEVGTFDSLKVGPTGVMDPTGLTTGIRHVFTGTAYCKGTTTASGVNVRTGIAASDPGILPVGSVVNISTGNTKYNGVYTIMDTGPKVQGRHVDIYMWSCNDALAFGRQDIELTVLRLGWNPGNSVPSLVDRLFRRREANRAATVPAVLPAQESPVSEDSEPAPVEPAVVEDFDAHTADAAADDPTSSSFPQTEPPSAPQAAPTPSAAP
jgi:3D (Asp-Asp-Asp) domain-containing protein